MEHRHLEVHVLAVAFETAVLGSLIHCGVLTESCDKDDRGTLRLVDRGCQVTCNS